MAFANTGYATFFQNNVPVEMMGRFGSMAEMFQGIVQIVLTLILGLTAELFSLQLVCLIFSIASLLLAAILFIAVMIPARSDYFEENVKVVSG